MVLLEFVRVTKLQFWQSAGQDLESEIFLIAESVGSLLHGADLVVDAFDEAQHDLVGGFAVDGRSGVVAKHQRFCIGPFQTPRRLSLTIIEVFDSVEMP